MNRNLRGIPIEPFPQFYAKLPNVCHPYTAKDFNTIPFGCVLLFSEQYFNYSVTFLRKSHM